MGTAMRSRRLPPDAIWRRRCPTRASSSWKARHTCRLPRSRTGRRHDSRAFSMKDELLLDKRALRQAFERAAATYDTAAVLQNEVCTRMLARLVYIKHAPASILDAGSG